MTLAEKIARLRRQKGWSQEALAERLQVSRQSVSKWESGASQPEIDKVVALSGLFGVSLDALLLESAALPKAGALVAMEAPRAEREPSRVTLQRGTAMEYLEARRGFARRVAWGVSLCVASPAAVVALLERHMLGLAEPAWEAIGVILLLELIAAAVWLFISAGTRMAKYAPIERQPFELEPGLEADIAGQRQAMKPQFAQSIGLGVGLCIVSTAPVVAADMLEWGTAWENLGVAALLLIVAAAVFLFVRGGLDMESFEVLLQEGVHSAGRKQRRRRRRG